MISNNTVAALMRNVELYNASSVAAEDLNGRSLTVREVRDRSNRLISYLRGQGLRKGDRVAYVAPNLIEFVDIDFGLSKGGFVKVPILYRLSPLEISAMLTLVEARAVIADPATAARLAEVEFVHSNPSLVKIVIEDGTAAPPGWRSYDQALAASKPAPAEDEHLLGHEDLYQIRFTSGSTGRPKGVLTTHSAAREAILGNLHILLSQSRAAKPRNLIVIPIVMAAGWSVLPTLMVGGTNVISPYEAGRVIDWIVDHQIDWCNVMPTVLRDAASEHNLTRLRQSKLDVFMYGGEAAPVEAIGRLLEHTDCLVQVFGQVESPSWTSVLTKEDHRDQSLWRSCGRPTPFASWATADDEGRIQAPGDGVGELVMRSATICAGFLGGGSEHEARLIDRRWWRTGDVGRVREDGYIFIEDRKREIIISGGFNVYPVEIERTLEEHPDVVEAAAFGVEHPRWGERPVAVVYAPSLDPGSGQEILEWLRDRLSRYKLPDRLYVTHEELPRHGKEGKLRKAPLKEQYGASDA